jgi:hypothetical protein
MLMAEFNDNVLDFVLVGPAEVLLLIGTPTDRPSPARPMCFRLAARWQSRSGEPIPEAAMEKFIELLIQGESAPVSFKLRLQIGLQP